MTRADLSIDFCYEYTAPLPNFPTSNTSAQWTGQFVAPAAGTYALSVDCPEPYTYWIDGKPGNATAIKLAAGQAVDLRLEYRHTGVWARCALMWDRTDLDLTDHVVAAVADADVVIFASGLTGDLEGEEGEQRRPLVGVNGDRDAIEMPPVQERLLKAIVASGRPTVLVNFAGGATAMPWAAEHVPAIVQAWYPGQAGATAVTGVLFGDTNPAGRLPVTFYRATADLPPFDSYAMAGRTYRYATAPPLWAFGHGLSYTSFRYDHAAVEDATVEPEGTVRVSVDVTNAGHRDGDDVVQAYVRRSDRRPGDPAESLAAVARVSIPAGQTRHVPLAFPVNAVRTWDVGRHDYVVAPGRYQVTVGTASDDPRATLNLVVLGGR